jgi:hypothetical protein
MKAIYKEIQEKLENQQYAEIASEDYEALLMQLGIESLAKQLDGTEFSDELRQLREWVYTRIVKAQLMQPFDYLNEHCCIGIIYGIFRMFDEFNIDFSPYLKCYLRIATHNE